MAYTLSGNSYLLFYVNLNYSIYIVLGYFTYTVVCDHNKTRTWKKL